VRLIAESDCWQRAASSLSPRVRLGALANHSSATYSVCERWCPRLQGAAKSHQSLEGRVQCGDHLVLLSGPWGAAAAIAFDEGHDTAVAGGTAGRIVIHP
jgi:hypothetical protein